MCLDKDIYGFHYVNVYVDPYLLYPIDASPHPTFAFHVDYVQKFLWQNHKISHTNVAASLTSISSGSISTFAMQASAFIMRLLPSSYSVAE